MAHITFKVHADQTWKRCETRERPQSSQVGTKMEWFSLGGCTKHYTRHLVYVHFRWTMDGPDSSYSSLVTHISSKVEREAKMDPPIQTEYLRSGGATILMVMV